MLGLFALIGKLRESPWADRLVSPRDDVRNFALRNLSDLPAPQQLNLVPLLANRLDDPNPSVRLFALYSLRVIGAPTQETFQAIRKSLRDSSKKVREEALVLAMSLGRVAVPILLESTLTVSEPMKERIFDGFRRLGEVALPPLRKSLRNPNDQMKINAASGLKTMGPAAKAAKDDLLKMLSQKNLRVRLEAALALNRIDPSLTDTLPIYNQFLRRKWSEKHYEVIAVLGGWGRQAKTALPSLNAVLKRAKDGFGQKRVPRAFVAHAVEKIDPRRVTPLSLLWDLKQPNALVRYRAALKISELDPPNRGTASGLVKALTDEDVFVVARALYALDRIGLEKLGRFHAILAPRILKLLQRMEDPHTVEGFRSLATSILRRLPPPRDPSVRKNVEKLLEAGEKSFPPERSPSKNVLINIEKDGKNEK